MQRYRNRSWYAIGHSPKQYGLDFGGILQTSPLCIAEQLLTHQ